MLFDKKQICLLSPCTGSAVSLKEVPDEAFSEELLGKGFAVEPADGIFYAPIEGRIESIAESKHAYTVLSDEGLDVLVHIGVDTVRLGGEGFVAHVKEGQRVCAGELLAEADIEGIRQKGLSAICSVLVTNPERMGHEEYKLGACMGGKDAVMCFRLAGKGLL
jgi:glucose-specific phosphotransferase system IIA component